MRRLKNGTRKSDDYEGIERDDNEQNDGTSRKKSEKKLHDTETEQTNAEESVATRLKRRDKVNRKRERFLTTRMWLSTFISKFFADRGSIPNNIGNNILITNNVYVTKNHISALVFVTELSEITPLSWTSDIVKYVKDQTDGVVIDITFKGQRYTPDITPAAIGSREKAWRQMLDNPMMPESYVRRAARCLYTLDVARSSAKLYKQRVYITIRAEDGARLRKGIESVGMYLSSYQAKYQRIQSNMEEHLAYIALMSDKRPEHLKDFAPCIFSTQTFAESMPAIQGANDNWGVLFGYDMVSNYPYYIDMQASSAAKNILVEALSGWGKTFFASYWLYAFYASGFNLTVMDIKGNEFMLPVKTLGGVILSMRANSTKYINTFAWHAEEVFDDDMVTYAHGRFSTSKSKMLCICDLNEKEESRAEALFEEFLQYVYASIGASINNVNTWSRTHKLNPYVIFEMFEAYLSNEIREKYSDIVLKVLERLRIYMSRNGSKSHTFRDAYSYLEVLESKSIAFDFGILESSSSSNDRVLFHLHVMDMMAIKDEYVSYKKMKGEWTLCILEESQVVDNWLSKVYTREITLRRSQNQVTALLGNSVAALAANPNTAPILENINILCLGSLNKSSRKYLIEEYGLKESEIRVLEEIQTNPEMQRRFLLVNRMEADATTALLEAKVPESVSQSSLFKVVDTVD